MRLGRPGGNVKSGEKDGGPGTRAGGAVEAGHLAVREKDFALNPEIRVTSRTPPPSCFRRRTIPWTR